MTQDYRPDIRIRGWMTDRDKANLHGTEAIVYALIYQLSTANTKERCYFAGLDNLANWLNEDKSTLRKMLAGLTKRGYIITQRRRINRYECTTYRVNFDLILGWV